MGKYALNKDSVFLNDLTVADDGTVYVTESVQKGVYIVRPGSDTLDFFLQLDPNYFIMEFVLLINRGSCLLLRKPGS